VSSCVARSASSSRRLATFRTDVAGDSIPGASTNSYVISLHYDVRDATARKRR
jgi:hypothetical protein